MPSDIQIHEEVLVPVTFIGLSVVLNSTELILKFITALILYAINPVTMHVPLLTGGHTMAWLRVLTCTNKGLVAATTSTLVGRPDWPYQLRVRNLTHVDAIAISTPQAGWTDQYIHQYLILHHVALAEPTTPARQSPVKCCQQDPCKRQLLPPKTSLRSK